MHLATTDTTHDMGNEQILFMPKLYDETMHLLVQSKNYFSIYLKDDQYSLTPLQKAIYSAVLSRITLRLSVAMSWILAKRAYHAGDLTEEEMNEHYRVQFHSECLKKSSPFSHFLPSFVQKMCKESMALYARIDALDNVQAYHPHSA